MIAYTSAFEDACEAARRHFDNLRITKAFIRRPTKAKPVCHARFFVMAYIRARDPKRYSYPLIARIVGVSDHTTVLNGIRRAHELWGETLFKRLAWREIEPTPAQEMHSPDVHEIVRIGERNLARFVNGRGWEAVA